MASSIPLPIATPTDGDIGIVVAHPSALARIGLAELLRRIPGTSLLASVDDARDLQEALRRHKPALAIITPELRDAVRAIAHPPRLLLVATSDHPCDATACKHSCAFTSDRAGLDALAATLARIISCSHLKAPSRPCRPCPLRASLAPCDLPLSPREQQVFELIADGLLNSQIARILGVGIKTVETYRANIKMKLGLESSRAVAVAAELWRRGIAPGRGDCSLPR